MNTPAQISNLVNNLRTIVLKAPNTHAAAHKLLAEFHQSQQTIIIFLEILASDKIMFHNEILELHKLLACEEIWMGLAYNDAQAFLYNSLIELSFKTKSFLSHFIDILSQASKCSGQPFLSEAVVKLSGYFACPDKDYWNLGLEILSRIYQQGQFRQHYALFSSIFDFVLEQQDIYLSVKVSRILVDIITTESVDNLPYFIQPAKKLCTHGFQEYKTHSTQQILDNMNSICSNNPKFINRIISEYVNLNIGIAFCPDYTHKRNIIQTLTVLVNKFSKHFKANHNQLLNVLELVFLEMLNISEQIPQEWLEPLPGIETKDQNDPDTENIEYGQRILNELFEQIDFQQIFDIFTFAIKEMNKKNDWRYRYAALMAISQIAEYIKKKQYVCSVVEFILSCIDSQNPKIRYAGLHAIGQVSQDKREIIHTTYFDLFLERIMMGLKDPCSRVRSHAIACFTNFAEDLNQTQRFKVIKHMGFLIDTFLEALQSGVTVLQENSLGALHGCCQVLENQLWNVNYKLILNIISPLLSSLFSQTRYQATETYTVVLMTLADKTDPAKVKSELYKYLPFIKQMLYRALSDKTLVEPTYVVNGYIRLFRAFGRDALDVAYDDIFLSYVRNILINAYEEQLCENTFDVLQELLQLKTFRPYPFIKKIELMITSIECSEDDQNIKKPRIYKIYLQLLKNIQQTQNQNYSNYYKIYFAKILSTLNPKVYHHEFENDTTSDKLIALNRMLKLQPISLQQLDQVLVKIQDIITKSLQSIENLLKIVNNQCEDEQEQRSYQSMITYQEENIQAALQTMCQFYTTQPEDAISKTVQYLVNQITPRLIVMPNYGTRKLGFYIIDDIIEFMPITYLDSLWWQIYQLLLQNLNEPDHKLRQAVAYGLNLWIHKNNQPLDEIKVNELQVHLISASKIQPEEQNKHFYYAQDNVATAMGAFLEKKINPNSQAMLHAWLDYLPIKKDHIEAIKQHNYFFKMIKQTFTQSEQGLQLVSKSLRIMCHIYSKKKLSDSSIDAQIRLTLKQFNSNQYLVANSDYLWASLSEDVRFRLTQIQMETIDVN